MGSILLQARGAAHVDGFVGILEIESCLSARILLFLKSSKHSLLPRNASSTVCCCNTHADIY